MGYHRPLDREAVNHGMCLAGLNYGKRLSNEWSLFLPVVVFVVVEGGCVVVAGSVVVGSCVVVGGSVVVGGCVVAGGCVVVEGSVVVGGCVVTGGCFVVGGSVVIDGSVVEGCVVDVSDEKQKQRFFESMCF